MKQAGMAAIGLVAALWTTPTQLVSQTPTIDEALRRLGELKAQGRTKGEFETTEQFQGRRSELERRIESLIRGLYAGSGRIGVGAYDADKELFPVTFHGQNLVVHVPRSEAPSFKANASRVDASGKFWIEDDGIAYLAGSASLKIGAKTYRTSRGEPVIRILSTRAVCDVHKGGCWQLVGLALSPDGGKLVAQGPVVGQDGIFSQDVIEVATGWDSRKGLGASFGPVFSPDGRLLGGLLIGTSQAMILDLSSIQASEPTYVRFPAAPAKIVSCSFSHDGKLFACAYAPCRPSATCATIVVWDVATQQAVQTLSTTAAEYTNVAFRSDNTLVAFGETSQKRQDGSGFPGLWDASSSREMLRMDGHVGSVSVAFSGDGSLLATIGEGQGEVALWSTSTGQRLQSFSPKDVTFWGVTFSEDSKLVAASAGPSRYRIHGPGETDFIDILDSGTGELLRTLRAGPFYTRGRAVAINRARNMLATVSGDSVLVFEIQDMR